MFKKILSRLNLTDNKKRVRYISADDMLSFELNVLRLLRKYNLIGKESYIQSCIIETKVDTLPTIIIKEIVFPKSKRKSKKGATKR